MKEVPLLLLLKIEDVSLLPQFAELSCDFLVKPFSIDEIAALVDTLAPLTVT